MGPTGHWSGELSSSALSTATAVTALAAVDPKAHAGLIRGGIAWLSAHANADGGWGDTVVSQSNLSTTALVWAAFGIAGADAQYPGILTATERYLRTQAGSIERLVSAIEALYGDDRTFSVPITMTLALSGRLGPDGWQRVRPLPFELAALPRGLFGALRLPVVSYALPALIAIGQVIHHRSGRTNPLRALTKARTLRVLSELQPENGGFLEATPLTSFVTMSLAGLGLAHHEVTQRGVSFLRQSVRTDGSWPIDTNLATWVTTLSIKALQITEEKEAVAQYGTSDSGATLGNILGAAFNKAREEADKS
jgi:squalene-hopene/tetraprenyl-beta-curcumene cyclase